MTEPLPDIRSKLANTKIMLREAQDALSTEQARAEQRAIEAALTENPGADREKVLGTNEASRNRALTVALASDDAYCQALKGVRGLEAEVDRLEAQLESARDERRAREWATRERMVAVLGGTPVDHDNGRESDPEIDAAATQAVFDKALNEAEAFGDATDDPFGDDDPFAVAESPGSGFGPSNEVAKAEPSDNGQEKPADPILEHVKTLSPSPFDLESVPSINREKKYIDWTAALQGASTMGELLKTSMDIQMDTEIDDELRADLGKVFEKCKAAMETKGRAKKG